MILSIEKDPDARVAVAEVIAVNPASATPEAAPSIATPVTVVTPVVNKKAEGKVQSWDGSETVKKLVADKAAQIAQAMGVKGKVKPAAKSGAAKTSNAKRSTAGKKVAPKYRDPAHPENTWTGRGRMPQWVQALHAAGTLAAAEIKAAE